MRVKIEISVDFDLAQKFQAQCMKIAIPFETMIEVLIKQHLAMEEVSRLKKEWLREQELEASANS